jgi:hypothetical protein
MVHVEDLLYVTVYNCNPFLATYPRTAVGPLYSFQINRGLHAYFVRAGQPDHPIIYARGPKMSQDGHGISTQLYDYCI